MISDKIAEHKGREHHISPIAEFIKQIIYGKKIVKPGRKMGHYSKRIV